MSSPSHVIGIYPGSFDPVTEGHIDMILRAARVVDHLVVAVSRNEQKSPMFSVHERKEMLRESLEGRVENVEVDGFDGLLVKYAGDRGAKLIVRGIRAISDYEYELQMALMNRRLQPGIETIFLMAGEQYSFLSSRLVKEVIRLGGDATELVPRTVLERLTSRLAPVKK
jgi:pantetheine-phosphate adenylyltransferase